MSKEKIFCFHQEENGKCSVLVGAKCEECCSSRIQSAEKYLELLDSLIKYNKDTNPGEYYKLLHERECFLAEHPSLIPTADDWYKVYLEEKHRGSGGGSSEQDSNSKTSEKQRLKNNIPDSIKISSSKRKEIQELTKKWEEEQGIKLPRLSRSSLSHSKPEEYPDDEE